MNERTKRTVSRALPSQAQMSGHIRRARQRVSRTIHSSEPRDLFIQAALAGIGASLGFSLIRREPFASLAAKVVPMAVFAYLYKSWCDSSSASEHDPGV